MRWMIHGNLTPAVADALRRHGHTASTLIELQIERVDPVELLQLAHQQRLDIITSEQELANAPYEKGVPFDRCIVYLQLEGGDVEQDDAIDRLFERYKRLTPGRLYTVTTTRVKIRQLPGA